MQNLLFGFKHIRPEQRQFELDYIVDLLKLGHLTERMPINFLVEKNNVLH